MLRAPCWACTQVPQHPPCPNCSPQGWGQGQGHAHLVPYGVHIVLDDFSPLLHTCREKHAWVRPVSPPNCREKNPKFQSPSCTGGVESLQQHPQLPGAGSGPAPCTHLCTDGLQDPASSPSPATSLAGKPQASHLGGLCLSFPMSRAERRLPKAAGWVFGLEGATEDPDIILPPPKPQNSPRGDPDSL